MHNFKCFIIEVLLAVLVVSVIPGCGEDAFVDDDPNKLESAPKVSQNGVTISHTDDRRGRNCMDCHYEGNNKYVYTVAGTVYQLTNTTQVYPNATIKFYSGPDGTGTYLGSIAVDANGNFYTTEPMNFTSGVYPAIEGTKGELPLYMGNFITHGECNSCHGQSTLPIYMG